MPSTLRDGASREDGSEHGMQSGKRDLRPVLELVKFVEACTEVDGINWAGYFLLRTAGSGHSETGLETSGSEVGGTPSTLYRILVPGACTYDPAGTTGSTGTDNSDQSPEDADVVVTASEALVQTAITTSQV